MSGFKPPTAVESLFLGLWLLMLVGEILGNGNGVRVVVEEGSDAVLNCSPSTKEDLTGKLFDWKKDGQKEVFMYDAGRNDANRGQDQQFIGRVSHFQDQLLNGNASIKIQNTKMADSGNYSCIFPRLQPSQTFNIELVVGASKPQITTFDEAKGPLILQCKVQGASPESKVEWQDSSGNKLPAEELQVLESGGRYYVTLNTTVTKTDHYRCVFTQEDISHQTSAEIYVYFSCASPEPCISTVNETKDQALLPTEIPGASPKPKYEGQVTAANILPTEEPQVIERGGPYKGASPELSNSTVNETKDQALLPTEIPGASPKPKYEGKVTAANILPTEEPQVIERGDPCREKLCEDCSNKVHFGWLVLAFVLGAAVLAAVLGAVLFVLRAAKCITVSFNRGAAPDPPATSTDLTTGTPLLDDGVTGDHQHQNGSYKAPAETPPV